MSNQRLLENLNEIKDVLSDESSWTQNTFARDVNGNTIDVDSDNACSWCLMGAIYKSSDTVNQSNDVVDCLYRVTGQSVCYYNDNKETQHQDIVNLLNTAIANCIEVENEIT